MLGLSISTGTILLLLLTYLEPTFTGGDIFFEDFVIFTYHEFEMSMLSLWLIHILMWVPVGFAMGVSWERDKSEAKSCST